MVKAVSNSDIIAGYRSDHSIVLLTFLKEEKGGEGIWMFNSSLSIVDFAQVFTRFRGNSLERAWNILDLETLSSVS